MTRAASTLSHAKSKVFDTNIFVLCYLVHIPDLNAKHESMDKTKKHNIEIKARFGRNQSIMVTSFEIMNLLQRGSKL